MKSLLVSLFCLFAVNLALADREGDLAAFKKSFPAHVAGAVTDRSDPAIKQCYDKYRLMVEGLDASTLGQTILNLRSGIQADLSRMNSIANSKSTVNSEPAKHAARQNAEWLKQKLTPYLHRLEEIQRRK